MEVEMEPCDWLLAKDDVSRLWGDSGGVIKQGLLHSEWEREPGRDSSTASLSTNHIRKTYDV